MKKLFTLFLALLASVGIIYASDTQVNGIWYDFNKYNKTAIVTYRGSSNTDYSDEYSGSVVIPSSVTYNGITYSVTSIGESAFYRCYSLTSVTIPNSVTSIGYAVFAYCSSLTSITIPNGVTSIGEWAFEDCSSLTSVTIPNGVTTIGDDAFYGCSSLTSVTIPNSVTSIGESAFYNCSSLTSPVYNAHCFAYMPTSYSGAYAIPEGIKQIAGGAFYGCKSLTSVTIPNSVTTIGDYAFSGCSSLTSITIPNSVTSIGEGAFGGCSSLTSITIPKSVTSIGDYTFSGCSSLNSVTIPNSVTSIGRSAFDGCESLTSITIPNSVTSIGDRAFYGCSSLTSITIPNSVTSIGWYAFYNCSSLTSVTIGNGVRSIGDYAFNCEDNTYHSHLKSVVCRAEKPAIISSSTFEFSVRFTRLYVPCGCGDAYRAAKDWDDFSAHIEMEGYSILIFVNDTKMGTTEVNNKTCKNAQIVATPKPGFRFVQWSDGVVNNPRNIVLTQDTVLIAEFAEIPSYVVEVIYNTDHGTVNGQGTYKEDEEVTLTATANDGYKFHNWSNGVTDNPYTFIVKSDVTLEAKFTSTEGIADVLSSEVHTTKVIRDGQVLILRNGKTYTMQGQEVK